MPFKFPSRHKYKETNTGFSKHFISSFKNRKLAYDVAIALSKANRVTKVEKEGNRYVVYEIKG